MLVAVSDLHLGSGKNLGPDRDEDIRRCLNQALAYALKKKVKYFVFLGDQMDYPNPSNKLRSEISKVFNLLNNEGIQTFVLIGNHEFANKNHAMSGLSNMEYDRLHIIDRPMRLLSDDKIEWIFLPHCLEIDSKTSTWKDIFKRYKVPQKGMKRIVLGHFPITGSKVGPSDYNLPASVTKKMLKSLHADLILLGDIHKPQKLFDKCYYVGSIDRINFGERKEKKRFLHITKKLKVKSIEIETRKLLQFIVGKTKYKKAMNAIIKPIINCNETDINKFDTALITHKLEKAGVHFIMPFEWNIEPRNRKKKRSTVSEINKKKYIKKYIKRNHPKANVDKLVRKYREIIKT